MKIVGPCLHLNNYLFFHKRKNKLAYQWKAIPQHYKIVNSAWLSEENTPDCPWKTSEEIVPLLWLTSIGGNFKDGPFFIKDDLSLGLHKRTQNWITQRNKDT